MPEALDEWRRSEDFDSYVLDRLTRQLHPGGMELPAPGKLGWSAYGGTCFLRETAGWAEAEALNALRWILWARGMSEAEVRAKSSEDLARFRAGRHAAGERHRERLAGGKLRRRAAARANPGPAPLFDELK